MNTDTMVRDHVVALLGQSHAHAGFKDVIEGLAPDLRGKSVAGLPYTAWQILEHLRISQWDILEFSRDASHVSPEWPEGYWPKNGQPRSAKEWDACVAAFTRDLDAMMKLVSNPATNLLAKIPHGTGQTILREALVLADHNAYHLGQLVILRRLLGAWTAKS